MSPLPSSFTPHRPGCRLAEVAPLHIWSSYTRSCSYLLTITVGLGFTSSTIFLNILFALIPKINFIMWLTLVLAFTHSFGSTLLVQRCRERGEGSSHPSSHYHHSFLPSFPQLCLPPYYPPHSRHTVHCCAVPRVVHYTLQHNDASLWSE